ncbi:hypothetical protein NPIL_115521 [Nephila pilipes]|uniref:Uncharacterized protein n=1 Tax=Nephila pilipes TaxID=299642 RepID=A0A8X6UKU7_NEPPI|nr:hypothetical protein NPIL_115521 [Nephila pilipes]
MIFKLYLSVTVTVDASWPNRHFLSPSLLCSTVLIPDIVAAEWNSSHFPSLSRLLGAVAAPRDCRCFVEQQNPKIIEVDKEELLKWIAWYTCDTGVEGYQYRNTIPQKIVI